MDQLVLPVLGEVVEDDLRLYITVRYDVPNPPELHVRITHDRYHEHSEDHDRKRHTTTAITPAGLPAVLETLLEEFTDQVWHVVGPFD